MHKKLIKVKLGGQDRMGQGGNIDSVSTCLGLKRTKAGILLVKDMDSNKYQNVKLV